MRRTEEEGLEGRVDWVTEDRRRKWNAENKNLGGFAALREKTGDGKGTEKNKNPAKGRAGGLCSGFDV